MTVGRDGGAPKTALSLALTSSQGNRLAELVAGQSITRRKHTINAVLMARPFVLNIPERFITSPLAAMGARRSSGLTSNVKRSWRSLETWSRNISGSSFTAPPVSVYHDAVVLAKKLDGVVLL